MSGLETVLLKLSTMYMYVGFKSTFWLLAWDWDRDSTASLMFIGTRKTIHKQQRETREIMYGLKPNAHAGLDGI